MTARGERSGVQILVFAKEPVAGRSKTRLSPPFGPWEAATLAEAMLVDTLAAVAAASAVRRVLVIDGEPGGWLPESFTVLAQRGKGQAERISAAFHEARGPALLIGMDTPQVTPELLDACVRRLEAPGVDAVIGPAVDGGWWALGLRRPDTRAFRGIPMSSPQTGGQQRSRLRALGLRCADLQTLRDVDTFEDALAVAEEIPGSSFCGALNRLLGNGDRVAPGRR